MRYGFALTAKALIIKGDKALILRRSEKEIKSSYFIKMSLGTFRAEACVFMKTAWRGF